MTYDEWRETYFSGPLMNETMARAAWSAAKAIEREACAKVCRDRYDEAMAGHEALDCEALILARGNP